MKRILIALAALWIVPVHAQQAKVVTTCGQAGYTAGFNQPLLRRCRAMALERRAP